MKTAGEPFCKKPCKTGVKKQIVKKGEGIILDMKYFLKGHLDRPRLGHFVYYFYFDLDF
jgi:hypothetical protein